MCGGPARPVLRLRQPDFSFKPDPEELARFEEWKQHVRGESGRVVVIELGCGELEDEPSTARQEAEAFVAELNRPAAAAAASEGEDSDGAWKVADTRATLVRINSIAPEADDPSLLRDSEVVSLLSSSSTGVRLLARAMEADAGADKHASSVAKTIRSDA